MTNLNPSSEEARSVTLIIETILRRSVRLGEEMACLRAVLNRIPDDCATNLIEQTDIYENHLTDAVDKLLRSLAKHHCASKVTDNEIS